MILRTARLVLRRPEAADLAALHRVFGDPRAMRHWSRPPHGTLDETAAVLDGMRTLDPAEGFDLVVTEAGRVIGKAGMWRRGEIGFILHPDVWGRGLGREAAAAVVDHAFATYPVDALSADVDPRNAGSLRLLQALGFVETGRAERTMQWGEEWCDSVYLTLTRAVWHDGARR